MTLCLTQSRDDETAQSNWDETIHRASLQNGIEKVALFALRAGAVLVPRHAALQLESGIWTSKMGALEDITHRTYDAVNGPMYGEAVEFLARPRSR
jgi:hypothetical protein